MIRQAKLEDMEQVLEVLSHLAPVDRDIHSDTFAKIMDLDSCDTLVWVSSFGHEVGDIIAVGSLWILQKVIRGYGKMGQIEDVVVLPEYRGSGFGKMIIAALIERAKDRGCYKIILSCTEYNEPFYNKCGFTKHESTMRIDL